MTDYSIDTDAVRNAAIALVSYSAMVGDIRWASADDCRSGEVTAATSELSDWFTAMWTRVDDGFVEISNMASDAAMTYELTDQTVTDASLYDF